MPEILRVLGYDERRTAAATFKISRTQQCLVHAHAADKLQEAEFTTQFWLAAMFCEVSQLIRVRGCQAPACLHESFNRFPTALLS